MLQPLIVDAQGIAHGAKWGTVPKGITYYTGTVSWCGTSLPEWVRLHGEYRSVVHQACGYDPRASVTCLECLAVGP